MARSCLFCDETKLTRAHLIGVKLSSLLPPEEGGTRYQAWSVGSDPTVREHDTATRDATVKKLCADCNGVWMVSLEEASRQSVVDFARGNPGVVTSSSCDQVAAWVVVVAMIRATMDSYQAGFSASDRSEVRRTSTVPDGLQVWLIRGLERTSFVSRNLSVMTKQIAAVTGERIGVPKALSIIWIGQAAFIVAHDEVIEHLRPQLMRAAPSAQRIDRRGGRPLRWPIGKELDIETILDATTLY
ncbi:MAG: hypothetical protein ACTIA6_17170 [Pseudoclavibacter sp.]